MTLLDRAPGDSKQHGEAHDGDYRRDLPAHALPRLWHSQDGKGRAQQNEARRSHGWGG